MKDIKIKMNKKIILWDIKSDKEMIEKKYSYNLKYNLSQM